MIELVHDGADENNGAGANGMTPEALPTVIGLGQAGIHVIDQLVMRGRERFEAIALDADATAVDGSIAPEKATLGMALCRGLGCYGDMALGRAVWKCEAERVKARLREVRQAVLAVGLGGGAGSMLAVEAVREIKRNEGRVIVVASLPFSFEPESRQTAARRTLAELRKEADAVLVFAADRADAWQEARQNIKKGLHGVNLAMARAVEAAAQIMSLGGMSSVSFADLRSLYGRFGEGEFRENCWLGRGEVNAGEGQSLEMLVSQVLESPLLDNGAVFEQADSGMACIMAGHEFSLTDLKVLRQALEAVLPKSIVLSFGTRTLDRHEGRITLSLLLASTRARIAAQPEIHLPAAVPVEAPVVPVAPLLEVVEMIEATEIAELPAPVSIPLPATKAKPAAQPQPVSAAVATVEATEERNIVPAGNTVRRTKAAKPVKQEELPFEAGSRGRFENSSETIHNGENLDQPTFLRRRLPV
ncbi:Cell division GTPase FtsZ [Verrucomicrobium sp. GAS474]|uniref:hypothetical protein n=1 Tax=Verrucomicrobium sp. GAS474 TaxID=1882831 RepID=UPI00087DD0E1|nr:hypothetical protein [Verrucomicrobium sp. GAS474]SDU28684.1 Cell division GTPase FtsZ [Verrucomicrobium sp. GAS474]